MGILVVLFIILIFMLIFAMCLNITLRNKRINVSQADDLDMINELMKRGILTNIPGVSGLTIRPEVLRKVHFHHMHVQQMTDIKNTVDDAAMTAAITLGVFRSMDEHDNHTHH